MGGCWSSKSDGDRSTAYVRSSFRDERTHRVPEVRPEKLKPLYGEYRCGRCKNFWTSRLSWPNKYQQCKRCKSYVHPKIRGNYGLLTTNVAMKSAWSILESFVRCAKKWENTVQRIHHNNDNLLSSPYLLKRT